MAGGIVWICLFRFGCHASELRSGLSGWMHGNAEVLELLAFCKPEQQVVHRFPIWRPLSKKLIEDSLIYNFLINQIEKKTPKSYKKSKK